jgi:hypothetical protein
MSTGNTPAPAASAAPISEAPVTDNNVTSEETQENSGQPGQEAQPTLTKQEIKRIKALKIKVDGQEFDEALPFEIDDTPESREYMTKQLQLARMSNKRAQTAADLQKKMDAIGDYLQQAKGDKKKLRALLKDLGADEKELAASIIEEEIENSKKSPEQLEKEKLEAELRELKDQQKKSKEEWEAREKERLYGQEAERYDMLVSKAIETSDLPKSPYVVKKMADYMLLGLENGIDIHPDDVISLVREEIQGDIQQMFAVMPEEVVEKLIGKDVLGKIRKRNVAKAKGAGQPPVPVKSAIKDVGQKSQAEEKPIQKKTIKQLWGV